LSGHLVCIDRTDDPELSAEGPGVGRSVSTAATDRIGSVSRHTADGWQQTPPVERSPVQSNVE
jgi:hypothetical protein